MIGMRARSGAGVVRLSAFAQSTGYLISIPGPLLVGVLYQHSGGWGLPIALMAGLMIPQMVAGILAGRDGRSRTNAEMRHWPHASARSESQNGQKKLLLVFGAMLLITVVIGVIATIASP